MNIPQKVTYKGWFPLLRSIFLYIQDGALTPTHFGYLIVFVSQMDFDKRHKYYGAIIRTDGEISRDLGLSESSVYKNRKKLIESGLLYEKDFITYIKNPVMFQPYWAQFYASKPPLLSKKQFSKSHDEIDEMKDNLSKKKEIPGYIHEPFNVSSKNNLGLSTEDIDFINDMDLNDE